MKKQPRQCGLVTACWMDGLKECGQRRTFLVLCAGEPLRRLFHNVLH